MTKLIFVAYYFPPMGGAGVQRAQKLVRYLPDSGYLPLVIAGGASSPEHWPDDSTLLSEISKEVEIKRLTNEPPSYESNWKRRIRTLVSGPTQFSKWWVQAATELAVTSSDGAKLVLATMPPFESGIVADSVSKRLSIPWIADLRDPWALDEIQVYPSSLHRKLAQTQMGRLLSRASLIVMNTPEAAAVLRRSFPYIEEEKVVSITNGFDSEDFTCSPTKRSDCKFRIVHSGSLLTENGVQVRRQKIHRVLGGVRGDVDLLTRSGLFLMRAIAEWIKKHPAVAKDLDVVFAGKRSPRDEALAESVGLRSQVRFLGYLSHRESLDLVRTADLLFLPMHNVAKGKRATTVPGKLYEYMASERPILAAVPEGDANDFLNKCGTALVCRPDDEQAMAAALDSVYARWKKGDPTPPSNRNFVAKFERRILTEQLASKIAGIAALRSIGTGAKDLKFANP